jgi:hypothetical protein
MTTLLERRRIEAELAKAMFDEMSVEIGEEKTLEILGNVARNLAHTMGQSLNERDGQTDLTSFANIVPIWQEGGALEIDIQEQSDTTFEFDVTRCRYAEMYHEIGAEKLGAALSCNRDGSLCEGYDARIKMSRTETIMGGQSRCNFRFTLEEDT